jgi:hypothetical protein
MAGLPGLSKAPRGPNIADDKSRQVRGQLISAQGEPSPRPLQ